MTDAQPLPPEVVEFAATCSDDDLSAFIELVMSGRGVSSSLRAQLEPAREINRHLATPNGWGSKDSPWAGV